MEEFNNNNFNQTEIETDQDLNYPNGNYNKGKDDIIQDNPIPPAENYSSSYGTYSTNSYNQGFKAKPTKRHGTGVVIAACLLSAVIGLSGGILGGIGADTLKEKYINQTSPEDLQQNNVNIQISETADSVAEAVAAKVTPSVVGIRTTTSVISFFGGSSESSGEGSGVIYSEDGYIITNYHVISEAINSRNESKIEVFLGDKTSDSYEATVVGYHISADLAVIKINAKGLKAVEVASSKNLKVGQYVITIGNPGGLDFMDSVTFGIISGLNRVVSTDSDIELIQTDAAINPGNSGGALVNTKGELVGINSSKIVSESYEGMGFAIPSDTAIEICKNIIEKENSTEPYVGIHISENYTPEVLDYYGYPAGAVVSSVTENSPAQKAGLRRGDIITEYNGTKISKYQVLQQLIDESTPGEKVTVKVYRSGRYYSATLEVGSNNQLD